MRTPAPAATEKAESPDARARRLLQARIDIVFEGTLREGLTAMGNALGVAIEIRQPREGREIDEAQPVIWNLRGCTAEGAVEFFFAWRGLSWTVEEGRVVVFAKEDEQRWMKKGTVPIDGLLKWRPEWYSEEEFIDALADFFTILAIPNQGDWIDGQSRPIRPPGGEKNKLILTATPATWRRVDRLANRLQTALAAKPPISEYPFTAENAAALAALRKRVTLDAEDMPLCEFLAAIERQIGTPVNLDREALKPMDIRDDTPITFKCAGLRASDVLARVFRDVGLDRICHGGTIVLTSKSQVEALLKTVVFDVGDLAVGEGRAEAIEPLIERAVTLVAPMTWGRLDGGFYTWIHLENRSFFVASGYEERFDGIARLFEMMRRSRKEDAKVVWGRHDETTAMRKALRKEVTWEFNERPLGEAVGTIAGSVGIPVYLDRRALDDVGIGESTPISLPAGKYVARDALRRILHDHKLTTILEYGGLTITTREQAEVRLGTAVFDVSSLVDADCTRTNVDSLVECITSTVSLRMWDDAGGPGTVFAFPTPERTTLVVRQSQNILDEINAFLDALRNVGRKKARVRVIAGKTAVFDVTDLSNRPDVAVKWLADSLRERIELQGRDHLRPVILPDGRALLVLSCEARVIEEAERWLEEQRKSGIISGLPPAVRDWPLRGPAGSSKRPRIRPRAASAKEPQPRPQIRVVRPAPAATGAESFEEKTMRLLRARVNVVYNGTFLDGLDAISRAVGIRIYVDGEGAEALGIDEETPADWNLRGCTARDVLEYVLGQPFSAEWLPIDDRIVVFYETRDSLPLVSKVLNDTGLRCEAGSRGFADSAVEELPRLLENIVDPTDWQKVGGSCSIERRGPPDGEWLALTATPSGWRGVSGLLKAIEKAAKAKSPASVIPFMEENATALDALKKPVTVDARNVPFRNVVRDIERQIGIPINFDRQSFREFGIDPNRPVTLRCRDLRLSDALGRISGETAPMCVSGTLLITTREQCETCLSQGVFDIHDLVSIKAGYRDVYPFIEAITTIVRPTTWDQVGGPGSIEPLHLQEHTLLVVSQTQEVLGEIKTLLNWIREASRKRHPVLRLEAPGRAAILKSLEKESRWRFHKTPLDEALATISNGAKVDIYFDHAALDDVPVATDTPVSLATGRYTAREALRRILDSCGLKYSIEYGGLIVTTRECGRERLDIAVYDVSDFVVPENAWGYSESLIECITTTLDPTSWDAVGGEGSIAPLFVQGKAFLVIRQTAARLDGLTAFFDALRKCDAGKADTMILENEDDAAVRKALRRRLAWSFDRTPLKKAVDKIAADLGVEVNVDRYELKRAGIDPDAVVLSIPCRTLDAPEALGQLLEPQRLGFAIEDASLVITTRELAEYPRKIAIYRVPGSTSEDWERVDEIIEAITENIDPETWDAVGGPGAIGVIGFPDKDRVLVVSNADRVLFKVDRYMEQKQ